MANHTQEIALSCSGHAFPLLISAAGHKAKRRFMEFFTANIRNRNTREAYARAISQFCQWCDGRKFSLELLEPVVIAAYTEELGARLAKPSVKQHLAAIRMLFDYLVVGQVIPMNPAASVRGPKYVVKRGKTPLLIPEDACRLLDSIETTTAIGLRDRTLIAVMVYSFGRISAVVEMNVEDFFQDGRRSWFRFHEKGGKCHEVPAHHNAEAYLDAYLRAAEIGGEKKAPILRTAPGKTGALSKRRLKRTEALQMIKRRVKQVGLPANI